MKDNCESIIVDGNRYRKNVGIIIYNKEGQVLLCERSQANAKFTKYKWQFPQGGVDLGEIETQTVMREMFEETGIKTARIVYEDNHWHPYRFPAILMFSKKNHDYYNKYKGQIQKWFLIEFQGTDDEIKIPSEEFSSYKWATLSPSISRQIVPFKRKIYEQVIQKFAPILTDIMKIKKTNNNS